MHTNANGRDNYRARKLQYQFLRHTRQNANGVNQWGLVSPGIAGDLFLERSENRNCHGLFLPYYWRGRSSLG